MNSRDLPDDEHASSIAIIGMAGRFPGAPDIEAFWRNLRDGIESVRFYSDEELREAGVDDEYINSPNYVKAAAVIDEADHFDARFFNLSPNEAQYIDPQHRVFMECAVEALDNAGCDPDRFEGAIGVYAGSALSTYELEVAFSNYEQLATSDALQTLFATGIANDYLVTRVSYKLNLRGPGITVQTACSTSLVAVHLASQSLLSGECDVALAGGVSIQSSYRKGGYFHTEGGMVSGDGHCRPFDADASGTIFGDGVGIVVLKRLDRAIADGDNIRAVVRGTAINNDGLEKLGFTAPGVRGQSAVITEALAAAGVPPDTVDYVEAHGTGTILGDPIEIAALTQVYTTLSPAARNCLVGSAKGNVGHMNHAAGITGLIKVVMSMENEQLPPSLNYRKPNPNIDFSTSPFRVNTTLTDWPRGDVPRRAGVNAFGIGGTNAHVIVEEAPLPQARSGRSRKWWLLPVSAKSADARTAMLRKHAGFLREHDDLAIKDVAYTLALGRTLHRYASFTVSNGLHDAADAMERGDRQRVVMGERLTRERKIAFMFPGQGTQHVRMGLGLYDEEPIFREVLDDCLARIERVGGVELRAILFPGDEHRSHADEALRNTAMAQPAIFAVSYALAALWRAWGVQPTAMIGHSIGELVAACVAGVFTLDDAIRAVCERGRLMQAMEPGKMAIVPASHDAIAPFLGENVAIAAINAHDACVISGPADAIDLAESKLRAEGLFCTDLRTSHAFHSAMMKPAIPPFVALLNSIALRPPQIPFASNVTGRMITAEEATSAAYWGQQLGGTVHFAQGLGTLLQDADIDLLLEVGPGCSLASLGQRNLPSGSPVAIVSSMPRADGREEEGVALLKAVAQLILAGVRFDLMQLFDGTAPRKVELPPTHFVRERYWAAVRDESDSTGRRSKKGGMTPKALDSLYSQVWTRALPIAPPADAMLAERPHCLIYSNGGALCDRLAQTLHRRGLSVVVVEPAAAYARTGESTYTASPDVPEHFAQLLADLQAQGRAPNRIVYAWSLPGAANVPAGVDAMLDHAFFGLLHSLQALALHGKDTHADLLVVGVDALEVLGTETPRPASALAFGPALVACLELVGVNSRFIDVTAQDLAPERVDAVIDLLLKECCARTQANVVAYRGGNRWLPSYEAVEIEPAPLAAVPIRHNGVYLITGGLGDLGLAFAHWLAREYQAKLILVGRTGVAEREHWPALLAEPHLDPKAAGIVQRLLDIEAAGGEILLGKADSSDQDAMRALVVRARQQFGEVHGVLHLAGLAGTGPMILRNRQELMPILAPKVHGIDVIETLFADAPLDFLALFSSIAAITGGLGQAAYTSANAYMDAYSRQRAHRCARRVIAINWDAWGEIGMAVTTPLPDRLAAIWEKELASFGISTADGIEIFRRLLATGRNGVLVSRRVSYADDSVPAGMVRVVPPTKQISESALPTETTGNRYPRPPIATEYVAPRNELETILVEFWGEALSVDGIGVLDDFFELGGHSLLALQMIPRLRARFGIDINPRDLFSAEGTATIAELAKSIELKLLEELGADEAGVATGESAGGAQGGSEVPDAAWLPAQEPSLVAGGAISTSPLYRE